MQFNFIHQDDGLVNVFCNHADQKQQQHLLTAAQAIVTIFIDAIGEDDLHLLQFVTLDSLNAVRRADLFGQRI